MSSGVVVSLVAVLSIGIFREAGLFTMLSFIVVMGLIGYLGYQIKLHQHVD